MPNPVIKTCAILTSFGLLSGCTGEVPFGLIDPVRSDFATVSATGVIDVEITNDLQFVTDTNVSGAGGYTAVAGSNDTYFGAYAGLMDGTDMGAPVTGSSTLTGTWKIAGVTNIARGITATTGDVYTNSGSVTLNVDFANQTLKTALSIPTTIDRLTVDADINATNLSGTVKYRPETSAASASGTLQGLVGQGGAMAVFHGEEISDVFAGGLQAN